MRAGIAVIRETLSGFHANPQTFLSLEEHSRYRSLPIAKRQHFLLGRLAAKRAVCRYLQEEQGHTIPLSDIVIGYRPSGVPYARCVGAQCLGTHSLSISHTAGFGVAALTFGKQERVGVDVEMVRHFSPRLLRAFLTAEEQAFLGRQTPPERSSWATLFWCYKEAYLKALGVGLRLHPRKVEISLSASGELLQLKTHQGEVSVRATKLVFPGKLLGAIVSV